MKKSSRQILNEQAKQHEQIIPEQRIRKALDKAQKDTKK